MKRVKVLFLDLDGTIRYSNNGDFINGKEEVEVYGGVKEVLKEMKEGGYILIGISNQGGVAFGYKTENDVIEEIERTMELLGPSAGLDHSFYCVSHPNGTIDEFSYTSLFRKPNTGMLAHAEYVLFEQGKIIDWDNSIMVGDRKEDRECANRAGIRFIEADKFFNRK